MELITKEEFVAWLGHPTTIKIRQGLAEQVLAKRIYLSKTCGEDQFKDRYNSGIIAGIEMASEFETIVEFPEEQPDASDEGPQTTY